MSKKNTCIPYHFFDVEPRKLLKAIGQEKALAALDEMLKIRNFERRGEQSYQMGKVWGFYHAYTGQEAIQTGAILALGREKNLWVTTYRCHALALLLGMTVEEGMCELYGKVNGNAKGRGGSMHFYTDNMYGGNGIVGGQWPMGAGLAFSLKYQNKRGEVAVCFGGDGSVAQGSFHESMNLAKLWKLPLIVVIENNQLGMGTQIERAICNFPIGESFAKGYGIKSYTVDGMSLMHCYGVFREAFEYVLREGEPVIIEAVTQRFRGHSISDAAEYRSKEELEMIKQQDPIDQFCALLKGEGMITEQEIQIREKKWQEIVIAAMKFADESPYPNIASLEEGVMVDG